MSKRGRRRSSRRRKSSSSRKQSTSQYISPKNNNEEAEKSHSDSFGKENADLEDDGKHLPPKEKKFKYDCQVNVFQNQRNIYTATTNDEAKGVKIVTSVSVEDMDNSTPNITFQQLQEPLETNPAKPGSSIMKINCQGSKVKLELQETNTAGVKTSFVVYNEKGDGLETVFRSICERIPCNDQSSPAWTVHSQYTPNFSFSFSSNNQPQECPSTTISSSNFLESSGSNQHCLDHQTFPLSNSSLDQPPLAYIQPRRKYFGRGYSSDQSHNITPPNREVADSKCNTLDDLILGVSSCRIDTCSPSYKQGESFTKLENSYSLEVGGGLDLEQLSDSGYDPTSMRPSVSTNRSSFTDFINSQKTKSWVRNNSIATVEHKTCSFPKKRRQTFPRLLRTSGSLQEDHLMHFREPFSSDTTSSLYHHTQSDRQGSINMDDDKFAVIRSYNANKVREKCSRISSRGYTCIDVGIQGTDQTFVDGINTDHQSDKRDCVFEQENCQISSELPSDQLNQRTLAIQVIPPSCCTSVEQMLQPTRCTLGIAQDFDMISSEEVTEDIVPENKGIASYFSSTISGEISELPSESGRHDPLKSISLACLASKQQTNEEEKMTLCRSVSDTKELLKPVESGGPDHWAKRRKMFKESKQKSSTGEGSITSDITDGSVSEDAPSLDMTTQDTEVGGFYTETFHSAAWVYHGDNDTTGAIPPTLNSRSRVVSIRERTVRINKGTGDYPWGFRIQFSKPIVVTEVDTNGAAEEAGLMVGDYVLAVNGTDVTSIPHSEAADLARQGPDVLTLIIGSDIARGPNTPRPGCRGYLHKRTQSGLIKGWRKRWFVLTHDCCLHYYRHKRDEGKRLALCTIKLEGAEVGPDLSLGKQFVFKCRPLLENRVYFFCATSNQEMKRWIEALEKAIHPVTQNHVWVDVTRHNSNLPPLAVKNPECLGLLHKMDRIKDMWIQNYCILKDGCLYLYSGIRATHAHGGIYLQGYTVREQSYGSRKCTIELKPPSDEFKSFYLCAENPNDNKRWLAAIKASIKKWLPLHQALQDYNNHAPEETRM
ncbi:uncharacterized protein pdzph1 [Boleophthalmus pectinirostris]|uniref:uncharacterized protein pdzph1 n=1 Tax=Boleophthalmus pectinirostris TaxID=150288 RepID=UPI00242D9B6A|nr:uncharacterized protein pdzph1 [Boleophthalmus pectinirostris]XP_055009769.1 uncharacterized protein pdzph1 [Boleophthalmus pectinirostris]